MEYNGGNFTVLQIVKSDGVIELFETIRHTLKNDVEHDIELFLHCYIFNKKLDRKFEDWLFMEGYESHNRKYTEHIENFLNSEYADNYFLCRFTHYIPLYSLVEECE